MPSRSLTLRELFPAERIRTDVSSVDKESLFVELVDLIASTSDSPFDRPAALSCVMAREAMMSTGIREGIAVPHGKTDTVDRLHGSIGISRLGVDYDAFDDKPVRVAFMIVSPRRDPDTHLRTLKLLAEMLDMPGFVEALTQAADPAEAHRVIRRFEDRLGLA